MKKKILSAGFALALLVAATAGVLESKKNNIILNDLALANVEALANGESGDNQGTLYGNESGTRYCCCPGSNNCSATACASSVCK